MMTASSKPTEEDWRPSSLLASNALSGHQGFDSIISDAKSTADTTADFYYHGLTSRRYALVGVACSIIFSCLFIIAGVITCTNGILGVTRLDRVGNVPHLVQGILMLIVTLCTESIGFVHGVSLRSALASESRLRFNTNLRLLTAARGWYNPNGALLNCISAVLLIISYSSASVIICLDQNDWKASQTVDDVIAIAGIPIFILGVALLLQAIIALSGMWAVNILTWSSSPFDLTAALVHHAQLTLTTSRCMRRVSDIDTVRKVVIFLWVIVAACAGWAALVMYIWDHVVDKIYFASDNPLTLQTWSFFRSASSNFIMYWMPGSNLEIGILLYLNIIFLQGPLTLGLHCSELIANVIRDERQWRCATRSKGLRVAMNPLESIFNHPIGLILFIAKPFLHWMFGLSFGSHIFADNETIDFISTVMHTAQIWNLCIALFIFSCFFTFVALRRPSGPQPAAYGHLQTLADLVDEWSPVMWWGHKEDGIPYCHAGTSDHPLPDVKMHCVYAGSGVGSLVPLS
ncbi:uncharacterized protein F5891DRAFT_1214242 [Suillus fuscotomentosus]|uniref:Uncharacterized protein n=1 Tax=Suillus fuscotomentosus TaxID=1912939 RepID=A0AAD4EDG8_9AGAM|nr:uncharacterized protein F5891DRAFT_1214242 [Suillus fuscotomentosus]KAG1902928.1 hypothetical protein F5891DRAFT_1214242 [Suillus fuscotomentosus]